VKRKSRKAAEVIARQIVTDIVTQRLEPGTRLAGEAEMMSHVGVSRYTLREALRLLEVQGIVVLRPGPRGGPVVADVTARDFADPMSLHLQMAHATYAELLEARLALEPFMTRLAAQRRSPDVARVLKQVTKDEMNTDLADDAAFQQLSHNFHAALATISGSRVLDLLGQSMKVVYDMGVRPSSVPVRDRHRVREVHRLIAEAIIAGDADEAERLSRSLLVEYRKATRRNQPGALNDEISWH
jgi:DNA-binding FadR family transcriptional regulator